MVKMIPPSLRGDSNFGERLIFSKLQDDAIHPKWVAIHGLTQKITSRKFEAEGDFVVLVPGKGIVIIEVKGATAATLEGEKWTFDGVAPNAVHKNPLEQIEITRANIKRRFRDNDLDDFKIPMARLVWLPKLEPFQFAEIGERGLFLGQWEVAFGPDANHAAEVIEKCLDEYIKAMEDNPDVNFDQSLFTEEYVSEVVRILLVEATGHATATGLSQIQQLEI